MAVEVGSSDAGPIPKRQKLLADDAAAAAAGEEAAHSPTKSTMAVSGLPGQSTEGRTSDSKPSVAQTIMESQQNPANHPEEDSGQENQLKSVAGDSYVETPLKLKEKRCLDLKGKLYLAPLTTIGNLPFRSISNLVFRLCFYLVGCTMLYGKSR